jgi:hypothetical protein
MWTHSLSQSTAQYDVGKDLETMLQILKWYVMLFSWYISMKIYKHYCQIQITINLEQN